MERILVIIEKYKKIMLLALLLAMCSIFGASYYYGGPFLESPIYKWLVIQIDNVPLLKNLINISEMIMDAIVRATYPMFILWAGIFYIYPYFKDNPSQLNNYTKIISLFIGGPSFIFLALGASVLGIAFYIYNRGSEDIAIVIAISSIILFMLPGIIFYKCKALLVTKNNKIMEKYSKYGAIVSVIIAFLGYIYSIGIEPYRTIHSIYEIYPSS